MLRVSSSLDPTGRGLFTRWTNCAAIGVYTRMILSRRGRFFFLTGSVGQWKLKTVRFELEPVLATCDQFSFCVRTYLLRTCALCEYWNRNKERSTSITGVLNSNPPCFWKASPCVQKIFLGAIWPRTKFLECSAVKWKNNPESIVRKAKWLDVECARWYDTWQLHQFKTQYEHIQSFSNFSLQSTTANHEVPR